MSNILSQFKDIFRSKNQHQRQKVLRQGFELDKQDLKIANQSLQIKRQSEEMKNLRVNEDYFNLFIQNVKDYAIFVLDTKGHVVSWNLGAERIKGYKAHEIIGKHISTFYTQKDKDTHFPEKELEVAKETGRYEDTGLRVRKDGTTFWANVIITAIFNDRQIHTGYVKITRDISERVRHEEKLHALNEDLENRVEERTKELQQREQELKIAKEAAEAANAAKSSFLANMSHEIRTPLGAILGFSELLVNDEVSGVERENVLSAIQRNGKTLTNLINDILDLSKVEAGKLLIEKSSIILNDLLQDLRSTLTLEASGKGISLEFNTEGGLPTIIQTDQLRIRQILLNIIGNAIKFTEKGGVRVTTKLLDNKIAFFVADTGTGISEQQSPKLFEPFGQADSSITRKFGGTGLGLALSKRLVNSLGGDIILTESHPGRGSTFCVTIDPGEIRIETNKVATMKGQNRSWEIPNSEKLANKKVLIVDDSPDNQALVRIILKHYNLALEVASNGIDAIEKAKTFLPDVILMDLQMPQMGGEEATENLRAVGFAEPIIALSAHAMKEERERCLKVGFDEYLTKPIDRRKLVETLIQFCS